MPDRTHHRARFGGNSRRNPAARSTGRPLHVERLEDRLTPTAPTLLSFDRAAGAVNPSNAASVDYTATFSQPVVGVDASDFTATAGTVTVLPVSDTVYTVRLTGLPANGSVSAKLIDNGSIHNSANQKLTGLPESTYQVTQQVLTTGVKPRSMKIVDINGDGVPDLAYDERDDNTVSVRMGVGDGTFQNAQTRFVNGHAYSLASGDLDGDGHIDLVSTNRYSGNVVVLLSYGNGTFYAVQYPAPANYPRGVTLADMNGDGKLDIVLSDGTILGTTRPNTFGVLLGVGDGSFNPQKTFAARAEMFGIAAADLNGDGKVDVVGALQNANAVGVYWGDGTGTAITSSVTMSAPSPNRVFLADINGDGLKDILTDKGSVFLSNGNGTFKDKTESQTAIGALVDVNGDGKLDAVAPSTNGVAVALGNGNGTFAAPKTYSTGSNQPASVDVADLNGDGKLDIATTNYTNNTVSVLLGAGVFTSPTYSIDTTAPTATLNALTRPASKTSQTSAIFDLSGTDATVNGIASGISYFEGSLDGAPFAKVTSHSSASWLKEGKHQFQYFAVDKAGNVSATSTYSWLIDLTGPTTNIVVPPAAIGTATSASVAFSGSDPTSNGVASGVMFLQASLDGAGFVSTTSPATYTNLVEGMHTAQFRSIDKAGNTGAAASSSWMVDLTAPTVAFVNPASKSGASAAFAFDATDPVSNGVASLVSRVEYQLDGGAFAAAASPLNLTGLTGGAHTLGIRAIDTAGNISTTTTAVWSVDLLPVVTSVAPFVGPLAGGTAAIILGSNFTDATAVLFGGVAANFTVNSATQITALSPPGAAGLVDVSVVNVYGSSATAGTADDFTYVAPAITSVQVNGGAIVARNSFGVAPDLAGQNSIVEQLLVTFSQPVILDADAFKLTSLASEVNANVVAPAAANVTIQATGVGLSSVGLLAPVTGIGYTQYILTFSAGDAVNSFAAVGAGNDFTTLKDGLYRLDAVGSKIHAGLGTAADFSQRIWSLFAAYDPADISVSTSLAGGSNTLLVDGIALGGMYAAFGSGGGGADHYRAALDWNLDGLNDGIDLSKMYASFGAIWQF